MSEQDTAGAKSGNPADPKADAKRQAALQGALAQIERQFGKGSVMRMGDPGARVAVDAIPPARCRWTSRWASAGCRGPDRGDLRA